MGTDDKLGESTDDIKSPGNPLRQSGQGGNHMNTVRSLGLMHDLQEYIVTVEAISAKRKAEIDRLKEANRDMERLLKMNKQAARRKEGSANESPTLAGPKTGFGDIANQDIPPKVRGIIEDNRMLKEEVKSYRDKHRQGERTIAAQQQQINKMKDEVEALRGKLKDCQRSPEQVASEAAMKEQLTAREGSVKELESRIEVLSHKLKVDARQHKDALKAKDKEIMEAKKKTEEVAAELAEKDLELRQKVLDAKAAAKKLDKCRNLLTESRREATNLHETVEKFQEEQYGQSLLKQLQMHEDVDSKVMLVCVYVDGGGPEPAAEEVQAEAEPTARTEFTPEEAATKVQSAYRGHLADAAAEAAATKIQAQARGHLARKQVNQQRAEAAAKGKETTSTSSAKPGPGKPAAGSGAAAAAAAKKGCRFLQGAAPLQRLAEHKGEEVEVKQQAGSGPRTPLRGALATSPRHRLHADMAPETLECVGIALAVNFDGAFVALGITLSFFACFAGLSSLSYALAIRNDPRFRLQFLTLMLAAGVAVGGCGIWTMHFLGMSAERLTVPCTGERIPLRYNVPLTVASLAVAIISSTWSMYFVLPAQKHAAQRRAKVVSLKELPSLRKSDINKRRKMADGPEFWVLPVKFRGRLVKLVKINVLRFGAATVSLALGACGMHYTGMRAQYGPYNMVLSVGIVAASVILALAVAGVGLFIILQVSYLGQVNTTAPRAAAAFIIALAVNCVHYTGATSATYVFTASVASSPMHGLGPSMAINSLHVGLMSLGYSLLQLMFCQYISEVVYAQQKKLNDALRRKLPADVNERLHAIYSVVKPMMGGAVADYIPELGRADPSRFGIAICDMSGEIYSVGDVGLPFTIQSCCKPLLYMMALEDLGMEAVGQKISTEPSGQPFDALSIDPSNRAYNPFVNAGAMVSAALLTQAEDGSSHMYEDVYDEFEGVCQDMVLEPTRCAFDEEVFASEMATNANNQGIAKELHSRGIIPVEAEAAVDVYTRCCSMQVTAEDAAVMAATLANAGANPVTGQHVFPTDVVEHTVTVMMSCGMYNGAGKWITEVGIPAKSGVAGLVMGVVPGVCGIAVFSPRLDQNGNSFRGVEVAKLISERFDLHVLRAKRDGSASADKPRGELPGEPKRRKSRAKGGSSCSGSRMSVEPTTNRSRASVGGDFAPTRMSQDARQGNAARPSAAYQDLSGRGGPTSERAATLCQA
eukprot:jgi/Tetstr1/458302/TSEL_000341.t1